MFARIQRFYNQGLWKKYQVHDAVTAKAITAEEYQIITGDAFDPNNRPPVE